MNQEKKIPQISRRSLLAGLGSLLVGSGVRQTKSETKESKDLEKLRNELRDISTGINEILQSKYGLDRDAKDTTDLIELNPTHDSFFPEYKRKKEEYLKDNNLLESLIYEKQEKINAALQKPTLSYEEIAKFYEEETSLSNKYTDLLKIETQLREILDSQNKGGSSL